MNLSVFFLFFPEGNSSLFALRASSFSPGPCTFLTDLGLTIRMQLVNSNALRFARRIDMYRTCVPHDTTFAPPFTDSAVFVAAVTQSFRI